MQSVNLWLHFEHRVSYLPWKRKSRCVSEETPSLFPCIIIIEIPKGYEERLIKLQQFIGLFISTLHKFVRLSHSDGGTSFDSLKSFEGVWQPISFISKVSNSKMNTSVDRWSHRSTTSNFLSTRSNLTCQTYVYMF